MGITEVGAHTVRVTCPTSVGTARNGCVPVSTKGEAATFTRPGWTPFSSWSAPGWRPSGCLPARAPQSTAPRPRGRRPAREAPGTRLTPAAPLPWTDRRAATPSPRCECCQSREPTEARSTAASERERARARERIGRSRAHAPVDGLREKFADGDLAHFAGLLGHFRRQRDGVGDDDLLQG